MQRKKILWAVEKFIGDFREVCKKEKNETKWQICRNLLQHLLRDNELRRHAQEWPVASWRICREESG